MTRNVRLYLQDILENMQDTQEFIRGMDYQQFAQDKKTFNAVLRSLQVIGEAAKHVPEELRQQYPAVSWREMAGMRDKVTHQYFRVDRETVWMTVSERIPAFISEVERILKTLPEDA